MNAGIAAAFVMQELEEALAAARSEAAELASLRDEMAVKLDKSTGVLQASAWLIALPLMQFLYFGLRIILWVSTLLEAVGVFFRSA